MRFSKGLMKRISKNLKNREETVAVAESVTSGAVQLAFSQMPDATAFFLGGITAYTLDEKVKHLNINPEEGKIFNCVSKNIVEIMALNVAEVFCADWSIATTGYATPVPESDEKVYALYCIAYHGKIMVSDRIDLPSYTDTLDSQQYYTEYILKSLRRLIKKD